MILYWVRHGETDSNQKDITQGPDVPLNEYGIIQADKVAERVAQLSIDTVFSSPFPRAYETAKTIATRIGKEVTIIDELRELMWAERYRGLSRNNPIIVELMKTMTTDVKEIWDAGSYEPFQEIVARTDAALSFFERQEGIVLAVSHGTFSKFFALRMMLSGAFTLPAWNSARTILRASNTGLSMFEFRDGTWRILTWNDHAHLG